jgi:hypothetical protein
MDKYLAPLVDAIETYENGLSNLSDLSWKLKASITLLQPQIGERQFRDLQDQRATVEAISAVSTFEDRVALSLEEDDAIMGALRVIRVVIAEISRQ